jgi:hypothetical protein
MLTFSRYNQTPLYLSQGTTLQEARFGFLMTGPSASLPATITLEQSWQSSQGAYLFFPALPEADSALQDFLTAAADFMARQPALFAWFPHPEVTPLGGMVITGQMQGDFYTMSDASLPFSGNMALRIVSGATASLSSDQNGFVMTAVAPARNTLRVTADDASLDIPIQGAITLPLSDSQTSFVFTISPLSTDLLGLGVGLRYFTDDLSQPGQVRYAHYPLFAGFDTDGLPLKASIDLLAPTNQSLSYFQFGTGGPAPALESYFRTTLGDRFILTPQADARLFLTESINAQASGDAPISLYLAPAGDYLLQISESRNVADHTNFFMCGLSGVEYIDFEETRDNVLTFIPNQNAFSHAELEPDPTPSGSGMILQPLTSEGRTSWAYVRNPNATLWYYAQPDNAALHTAESAGQNYLTYMAVAADGLRSDLPSGQEAQYAFPLVPYAGVQAVSTPLAYQMEVQVLSPLRRENIYRNGTEELNRENVQTLTQTRALNATATTTMPGRQGTTPQGFRATFSADDDETWQSFALAQTGAPGATVSATTPPARLQLNNISGALRSALQSNQLFLVVTSKAKFLQYTTLPSGFFGVTVENWSFNLHPDFWAQNETIWIFKKHSKSIADLAQDIASWNQPENFNDDVTSVQERLQAILADAQAKASDQELGPYFTRFLQLVQTDIWSGVLILNANLPPSAIPTELTGIVAGIDAAQLRAHHLILNQTPVTQDGTQLSFSGNTSIMGLINYSAPEPIKNSNTDYDFKVLSLNVLFNNSEIARFDSRISLLVNTLFSERATLQGSANGNNLILSGVYQQRDSSGSYVFSNQAVNVFASISQIINRVTIDRVQFSPVLVPATGASGNMVARFIMTGSIDFRQLSLADLLSFGYDVQRGANGGLSFSNLFVDMRTDSATPFYKTFVFNPSQIVLDTQRSIARLNSLYQHFPLTLKTLMQGSTGSTPQSLGYMPVDTPVNGEALTMAWFGLQFDLNMGSFGALAGQAGFTVGFIVAWSPDAANTRVFVGMKMPGTGGGNREISLEGIIRLVFGDVRLEVNGASYVLQLRNIALKVLTLSFPPYGQTALMLFGDPRGQDHNTLGWYAAFSKGA